MNSSDNDLVKECLEGNKKAFEEIVERYYKTIFRLSFRITRNHDDAEEITQSTFVKAYENLSSFNFKYKFFSWIYRIAVNESLNLSKKSSKMEQIDERYTNDETNPEKIFEKSEFNNSIKEAILQLELLYRLPVVLKHFFDYSYSDLSYILDIPEKTVKSRLYTGRQLLKDILINRRDLQNGNIR
ncbi:MAG TPA: sigma-70 family RNA polymerase sigma factor [Ignavibacteriaceae bacterium]|nr:sigma-70 family RNA polymerase sigma factor [Ignavibacteriaceae bacterium]